MIQVHDLGHAPGSMREIHNQVAAPENFSVPLIGVVPGSPLELDLRLEAVHEGILVSGMVGIRVKGECSRCLAPITYSDEVPVQELFYYPEQAAFAGDDEADEQYVVEDESLDLEPLLRNAVVSSLPFTPVCREDCAGLCSQCGVVLATDPEHHHEVLDPRWSALAGLAQSEELPVSGAAKAE